MISRPFGDNPHAHISQVRLPPKPHPTEASNRFSQPKTSAAAFEGASSPPQDASVNNAFASPVTGSMGSHIDVYA